MVLGGEAYLIEKPAFRPLSDLGQVAVGILEVHYRAAEFHVRRSEGVGQEIWRIRNGESQSRYQKDDKSFPAGQVDLQSPMTGTQRSVEMLVLSCICRLKRSRRLRPRFA